MVVSLPCVGQVHGKNTSALVSQLLDALPSFGINFASFIPSVTGVDVNITQLFSGTVLDRIRSQLNLTANDSSLIDVGQLVRDGTDGLPIVNTTSLRDLLPQVACRSCSH